MRYFLVILGFFLAFNPNGLCKNDHCCESDKEEVSHDGESCDHHKSCEVLMHVADSDNSSSDQNEDAVHNCDFCVISMLLPSYSDIDVMEHSFKPTLSSIPDNFSNRLYFSIWNPPNL